MDSEEAGGYSKFPWYTLRENYCGSVVAAGGIPLPLAHEPQLVEDYLNSIRGLIITGGAFDVDPRLFGEGERHETVVTKGRRTDFEFAITKGALERDMPVLGICGGQQLLQVILGGKLIQHLPDEVPNGLAHEQPNPRDEVGHEVNVKEGTLLASITGELTFGVNSAHHQAAKDEPKGLVVSAKAPDGVIEAIEAPDYTFCLGVQWHPEFFITPADEKIISAFIAAARNFSS